MKKRSLTRKSPCEDWGESYGVKVQLTTIEGEGRGPPYAYRVPT